MDRGDRVERFLEEKPWGREALEAVLAVEAETWDFGDVPLDSGRFGEVVSRGFVERAGDGYRLVDRGAVEDALARRDRDGDAAPERARDRGRYRPFADLVERARRTAAAPWIDRTAAATGAALAVLLLTRAYIYDDVFRRGDVVLLSNDPYYYRVLVEQFQRYGGTSRVLDGEPLMVHTLRAVAGLAGGPGDAGTVLAWYPVASAAVTAALVYAVARLASGERLVGGAAVLALGTMSAHAFRTALGFADHHAFDHPWLGLTLLAFVALATVRDGRRRWLAAGGLGAGVAGQTLAWDNGAMLLPAAGLAVVGSTLVAPREEAGVALLRSHAPHLVGLAGGVAAVVAAHLLLGWHTPVVVLVPVLLFAGSAVVVAVAAVMRRRSDAGPLTVVGAQLAVGSAVVAVAWVAVPGFADRVAAGVARIAADRSVAETRSLLAAVGNDPLLGPLLPFGLAVLALPLAVRTVRRPGAARRRWLPVAAYAGYLFPVALLSRRFAGHLAVPLAVLAGYGLVRLLAASDLLPADGDRWRLAAAVGLVAVLAAPGLVLADGRIQQATIDDDLHDATRWMADDAAAEPGRDDHVLNEWGRNRMANYFVSGEALSYRYAKNHYVPFLRAERSAPWGDRLVGHGTGYVAIDRLPSGDRAPPASNYALLYRRNGSAADGHRCAGRFRLRHAEGTVKVFEPVVGARLALPPDDAGLAAAATTNVSVAGTRVTYRCRATRAERTVRVAHPGTYTVATGEWTRAATVTERDVAEGRRVPVAPD